MEFWNVFSSTVKEGFLYISVLSIAFYLIMLVFGLFSLKTASGRNNNKPLALYHFTSKSCLKKIVSCRIIRSIKYGVVFSTSNKRKSNRGRNCNPIKRKGVIIFLDESLNSFKINYSASLLKLIFLHKIIEINTQEHITKSYGDLQLLEVEEINDYILLVSNSKIVPCNKKTHFIRKLKSLIKKYCNLAFSVMFLCAFLGVLGLLTDLLLIKLIMGTICGLYFLIYILLFFISCFLAKMDKMVQL